MSEKSAAPKIVLSNPSDGTAKTIQLDPKIFQLFIGKKIGDELDGSIIGFKGYKIKITGGTDRDGFPMRPDVSGPRKVRILLSGGVGYKPRGKPTSKKKKRRLRRLEKGLRKRKMVRGNMISESIAQINVVLIPHTPQEKKEVKEA
ncbi:MAG: 30S ribosomal protein S6e [Aigarchaeota archaeon]|nr:30S ribosomal protein S6e [Aigarchaeota archaeon]MCX8192742.1 30S ribosomal protein S6e [Nitrososphaeria archaeon]MDW7985994.1 30S ribosomal protein S6e [Nitrososphaerota archaeon]